MGKLGAQCQMNASGLLDFCRVAKPRAAMGIMVKERSFYEALRDMGVKSIFRHWPNFTWDQHPEEDAAQAVSTLKRETAPFSDILDYVLGNNEYIYSYDLGRHDLADRFASAFIAEAHKQMGIHAIVLNLNTGHFRDDITVFHRTLTALDNCPVCRLGWHEYDWPQMYRTYCDGLMQGNDGMWQTLRWKVASRAIKKAGFRNVKFAITECGLDGGVIAGQENLGFRFAAPNYETNYKASLAWYIDALERDDDVDFALLFGAGLNDDWRTKGFDVLGTEIPTWIGNYRIYPEVNNGRAKGF